MGSQRIRSIRRLGSGVLMVFAGVLLHDVAQATATDHGNRLNVDSEFAGRPPRLILTAKGQAEESYHPEAGESQGIAREKAERLKAEKSKGTKSSSGQAPSGIPTPELAPKHPKEIPSEDGISPPRSLDDVPVIP